MDIIPGLAKKYNVKLIDVAIQSDYHKRAEMPEDTYIEKSYCIGNEIILGVYSDPELRLVSFYHELGHALCEEGARNQYDKECRAWQHGFKLAKEDGIVFSAGTMNWCRQQLKACKDA